jgi:catechol 2,3-dioxygenase-like lactoylglutathione lyase family enzyme
MYYALVLGLATDEAGLPLRLRTDRADLDAMTPRTYGLGQNHCRSRRPFMRGVAVYLRGVTLFVAGIVVGSILMQPGAAQEKRTGLRLNHVGIAVTDYNKSFDFYTKVMGYHIAFKFPPSPDGKPTTTYFQINRDTFLEMAPASAQVPAGVTHMGIETSDIKSTIAQLRAAGGTVEDMRVSGPTKALLSNIKDPDGIRMELIELTPDSLHKKAEESWK